MVLKLNIGAGNKPLPKAEGWLNVDLLPPEHDIGIFSYLAEDVSEIPSIENASVDFILASHVIEHIHPSKVALTLDTWYSVLKDGAEIALEQPNILWCAINLISGVAKDDPSMRDQYGMWGIYGNSSTEGDFMNHMWGYYPESLADLLYAAGFKNVREETPQVKPWGAGVRDFRLVAEK